MPHVQRVRRAVKADIEGRLAVVDHLPYLVLIGHLCDQPPGDQFLINSHFFCSFLPILDFYIGHKAKKRPLPASTEGDKKPRYHLIFAAASRTAASWSASAHSCAVTGPPDTSLLGPRPVQKAAPGCIRTGRLSSLHPPEALCADNSALLFPSTLYGYKICYLL